MSFDKQQTLQRSQFRGSEKQSTLRAKGVVKYPAPGRFGSPRLPLYRRLLYPQLPRQLAFFGDVQSPVLEPFQHLLHQCQRTFERIVTQ